MVVVVIPDTIAKGTLGILERTYSAMIATTATSGRKRGRNKQSRQTVLLEFLSKFTTLSRSVPDQILALEDGVLLHDALTEV